MNEEPFTNGILIRATIEILGAPKEHIDKTLHDFVKALKQNKSLKIVKSFYADPIPQDNLFSMYVELEVWFKDIHTIVAFCIDAMPSTIEILEPAKITLDANDLSDLFNDLQGKLHHLDMSIKNVSAKHTMIEKNSTILFNNFVTHLLKGGKKNCDELVALTGIPKESITPLLSNLVNQSKVKKSEDYYSI